MIYLISPDERRILTNAGDRMPLGLLYLSSALKSKDIQHKVVDLNHEDLESIIDEIKDVKPQIVGLSCISPTSSQTKHLAGTIKENNPKTKVIVGGFHVSSMPGDFSGIVDAEFYGYGENQLLDYINGKNVTNYFDINQFPIPNRDILSKERYNFKLEGLPATLMVTSRGCPFSCSFCGNFDKKVKFRSADNISEELSRISFDGYKGVYLVDDSFTIKNEHVESVGRSMLREGLIYRIETRANLLSRDTIDTLADTGCAVVGLGIESGSQKVLDASCKQTTIEQVKEAVTNLGKREIKTKGFFMFGLPGETYQDGLKTIEFAKELKPLGMKYADFYILMPFPGTEIYRNPSKFGIEILDKNYNNYLAAGKRPVQSFHSNGYLTPFQMQSLRNKAQEVFEHE